MIGDRGRGWAWTSALLGLRALTIHVCGSPGVLPLLTQLARDCGDELQVRCLRWWRLRLRTHASSRHSCPGRTHHRPAQVRHYERLSPLVVEGAALGSLGALRPGDALVCFSRRGVHRLQQQVARQLPQATCALVYGALPPDARRAQASAFNAARAQCVLCKGGALPSSVPLPADAWRTGSQHVQHTRALTTQVRRAGGQRRHRHGPEPRHLARGLHRPAQV